MDSRGSPRELQLVSCLPSSDMRDTYTVQLEDSQDPGCLGVAGAVLLPVAGLGVGVAQIVRGAVNTPEAVRELNKGRFWDQVRHQNQCWHD